MKVKEARVGEIFAFHSIHTNPPKKKYHLCIGQNQFFFINTDPSYSGSVEMSMADYAFLYWDSHLCCADIFQYNGDFTITEKKKGDATRDTLKKIVEILPSIRKLSPIQKRSVEVSITARLVEMDGEK